MLSIPAFGAGAHAHVVGGAVEEVVHLRAFHGRQSVLELLQLLTSSVRIQHALALVSH
jgi:hypothetical protein